MVQDSCHARTPNFKLALKADTRPRGHKFFREFTHAKLNRACFSERIVPNWTFVRLSCVSADSINLFIWARFRSKISRNCLLLWSKLLLIEAVAPKLSPCTISSSLYSSDGPSGFHQPQQYQFLHMDVHYHLWGKSAFSVLQRWTGYGPGLSF